MANSVAARKIGEVLEFAKTSNSFLTKAASAALEHLPQTLQWEQVGNSPCFHARDQGCLYSINLLNGKVLQDGYPPRRVPASIMEHELYRRSFGDASFEVGFFFFWGHKLKSTWLCLCIFFVTLSPIIMEVENSPTWKETNIGRTHFALPWLREEE